VVNDRVDIALATGAHGVQLGRRSAPVAAARALIDATFAVDASRIRIGYSAHDVAECGDAVRDGADFILAGTIHTSVTHPGAVPVGIALLERMTAAVVVPVIAIGGMTAERFADAATAGAAGAALLGAVWHAADPLGAFVACIREAHVFKTPET
jgi:thiamine-phosphate diphosphorylase